jgi:phosphoglycolate phosphatase
MSAVRAIVLDFDGVLLESEPVKAGVFDEVFAEYPAHAAAMTAYNRAHAALPRRTKFEHCVFTIMERPGDLDAVDVLARRFSERVVAQVIACAPVPGAEAFLDEFSGRVPLFVSSVTPEPELNTIIRARGWERHFRCVFGDPPTRKPDAIRAILAREQLDPGDVVFVGDSEGDYLAAGATGVGFIGRDSGGALSRAGVETYPDMTAIAAVLRPRLEVR